jgi:hypothetical protein
MQGDDLDQSRAVNSGWEWEVSKGRQHALTEPGHWQNGRGGGQFTRAMPIRSLVILFHIRKSKSYEILYIGKCVEPQFTVMIQLESKWIIAHERKKRNVGDDITE